ncbi:MAG: glycosyltransferase [Nitriliruptorales bacterium]|nr:glycosyltransferase [Nitriliruptorales bacterium]
MVVSPYLVPPTPNGACVRIDRLTRWLKERGHEIFFIWAQVTATTVRTPDAKQAIRGAWGEGNVLEHGGRELHPESSDWGIDDWVDPHHERPFKRMARSFQPDVVLVNYVFLSKFLEWVPSGTVKYLDTHDRLSRRKMYERHGMAAGFFYTTQEEELRACQRADVVFSIQDNEREHFARSGTPVAVVGHPEPPDYGPAPQNPRLRLGFAAAYNKFNLYSVRALFEELEGTGVLARHGARLAIAGNLLPRALSRGEISHLPDCVNALGFVDDLGAFYRGLDLVVNPTIVGTGLKIKTVEAIAKGKPLLSTATGSEGLAERSDFHRCDGIEALVEAMATVLADPERLTRMANVSRHLHTEYMLNLERNLDNLFSPGAVAIAGERQRASAFVAGRTGPLAETDPWSSLVLTDPALGSAPAVSFVHVVNPVPAGFGSDLYSAQPVAFESLRRACSFARDHQVDVRLRAVLAEKDELEIPAGFEAVAERARVVTDAAAFAVPRPLPLLREILTVATDGVEADYVVYTNADIAVLPHFYTFLAEKVREGHDAIVVNRRTIGRSQLSVKNLDSMYTKMGKRHPGYDCFVFRRDLVDEYDLGDVAIGVHLVGRAMLWNVLAFADNPLLVDEDHVTFHLGDDNAGKQADFVDYIDHNTEETIGVLERLDERCSLVQRLEGPLREFAPNLLALRFNPGILTNHRGDLDRRFADAPIFVHALFRTGSTFLWSALRTSPHHRAYYEPLHEALAGLWPGNLDRMRAVHTTTARHELEGPWLFAEYEDLLQPGVAGVPGYSRRLAYETYADNSIQPLLRRYIDSLLAASGRKQPVLQMNRSALRQRWFHQEYPDAHHIYLARDPREQWASYLKFKRGDARGFARNDALICGMNKHRALIRPVQELVPLHHDTSEGDFFARYDQVFDGYSWEQRYTLFYYLWLQGLLEAAATGSHIVDMNRISESLPERLRFENFLAVRGAQADLSSLAMTGYSNDDQPLSADQMAEIERTVQSLTARAFGLRRFRQLDAAGVTFARGPLGTHTDHPSPS